MPTDTRTLSDCKGSDPTEPCSTPVEAVLDAPIAETFDQLLLAQLARRCGNWTAIVCLTPMAQVMHASPTKIRKALDRLSGSQYISVEPMICRCCGDYERYKIYIRSQNLGA